MGAGSETDRSTTRWRAMIAGEPGSGRAAAAIRMAAERGPSVHVVHGFETAVDVSCWCALVEPQTTPQRMVDAICEIVGDGALVIVDIELLRSDDLEIAAQLLDRLDVVAVASAAAAGGLTTIVGPVDVWTRWPSDAPADRLAARLDLLGKEAVEWLARWGVVADALSRTTLPVVLLPAPPAELLDQRLVSLMGNEVAAWPTIARSAVAAGDRVALRAAVTAVAHAIDDDALASDLLSAFDDHDAALERARRALVTMRDPDRRARLLARLALRSDDPTAARAAASALLERELTDEARVPLSRLVDPDLGVALLRQFDDELARWEAHTDPTLHPATVARERLTLVVADSTADASTADASTDSSDASDVGDDLDAARSRWGAAVLDAARRGDRDAVGLLSTQARSLGDRAPWRATGDDLDAVLAFHASGDLASVAALATAEPGPRLPRVVRDAHRVLALVDAGRSSDADALLEHTLGGPSRQTQAARRWIRLEVEVAAGRVVRAMRIAESTREHDDGVVGPVDVLATVAHAWAAHDAVGELPPVVDNGWPSLRAAVLEQQAIAAWRTGSNGADVAATFLEAATGWGGLHVRGELRARWAAGEVLRITAAGNPLPLLLDVEARSEALGMMPLLSRARQSLRRAGVRGTARRVASTGPLSAREREVLLLAGKGLTAKVIAQQLGVAASTVETQIASAMLKLGARTRVQAALMLAEGQA